MALKVLNRALVFLGCRFCLERAQIPALSRLRIFLSCVQPIFARLEFPDHAVLISNFMTWALVRHLHALGLRSSSKEQPERRESPNPAQGALGNSSSGSRDRNSRK
jgi:hypothetical protein